MNDELIGKLQAMEVLMLSMAQQLQADELLSDINENREIAITALLNTSASDRKIAALERTLAQYLYVLGLTK